MANMAVYEEQARKAREEKMKAEKAAMESARLAKETEKRAKEISAADRIMTEGLKRAVARELNVFIPLNIMNEAFSRMVIHALPHDAEYIADHQLAIESVNRIFLHHLGGIKYLKECAKQTGSYFLQDFYRVVKENSDAILKDKLDQLQQAQTEADVDRVIRSGITADQAEKLEQDIDALGPEEISELVQNKVLDVVKDESRKQSEDAAFRAELAARAEEYDEQNKQELNPDVADAGQNEENKAEDNKEKDSAGDVTPTGEDADPNLDDSQGSENSASKEEPQSESARLVKYLVDPTVVHESSLFYSIVYSVYKDMVKSTVKEDAEVIDPNTQPKAAPTVMTSPLNLNMFDVYLSDYQDDLQHVDNLRIADKAPLAGDEVRIDSEDVLAEALVQYTMLETAMTIKLINPSPNEVRAVAQYMLKSKK